MLSLTILSIVSTKPTKKMRQFAIDIGNTFCKIGFFENDILTEVRNHLRIGEARTIIETYEPQSIAIVDVTDQALLLCQNLSFSPKILHLQHTTPLPIRNLYGTPETLGMDRLAAVLGARSLRPSENHLVIDAGTCITYDFITQNGDYQGGSISLGLQMRLKALAHFTQKLPLVDFSFEQEKPNLVGKTTQTAILSGVINGLLAEIEGVMSQYEQQFGTFQTWFCGGDATFLAKNIKKTIQIRPTLLLEGLYSLMKL